MICNFETNTHTIQNYKIKNLCVNDNLIQNLLCLNHFQIDDQVNVLMINYIQWKIPIVMLSDFQLFHELTINICAALIMIKSDAYLIINQ